MTFNPFQAPAPVQVPAPAQPFNPFQAPAPVQVHAPAQPQANAQLGSLNSVVIIGGAPLLPHDCDGQYRVQITGYAGQVGYESGPAVHITFKILASSNACFTAGQEFRVMYKYDFERNQPSPGKQGTVHRDLLKSFIAALYKRPVNDSGFDYVATQAALHAHDWATQPGFVDLHCSSRPWQAQGSPVVEKRRRETWVAVPA